MPVSVHAQGLGLRVRVWAYGLKVWGQGRVSVEGFESGDIPGPECDGGPSDNRAWFRVSDSGCRVYGLVFRVSGFSFGV